MREMRPFDEKEYEKTSKYAEMPFETMNINQAFVVKYDEVKSLNALKVYASNKGIELGKKFRIVDNGKEYLVGRVQDPDREYYLVIDNMPSFLDEFEVVDTGAPWTKNGKSYRFNHDKAKEWIDNYRVINNIPKTIEITDNFPSYRGCAVRVTLEEIRSYQQQSIKQVENVVPIKPIKFD